MPLGSITGDIYMSYGRFHRLKHLLSIGILFFLVFFVTRILTLFHLVYDIHVIASTILNEKELNKDINCNMASVM